jgi:hypothetical protein
MGIGTPVSPQTDDFIATASNGGGTCTFSNTVTTFTCGMPLTFIHLTAGGVAPVNKTVTYETDDEIPGAIEKCWILRNLGASNQATAVNDGTEAAAGWYWQFNRKQGYKHDGTIRTPNSTWIANINETSDWLSANDPCALEMGNGWRLPTSSEWFNVDAATGGNWTNWNGPFLHLKMHAAGKLNNSTGALEFRNASGYYWSSTMVSGLPTNANQLWFNSTTCAVSSAVKPYGNSIRCIK